MKDEKRLPLVLLMIKLSVFLVMLVWTLDKFINPEHATKVYEHFWRTWKYSNRGNRNY